jgi:hypothetical protein
MAENNSKQTSSQSQQIPPFGAPFAVPALDGWKKLIDEQMTRFASLSDEMQKIEQKNLEHARQAVDEAAKLTKESLAYAAQIGAEWRKLAMEATRRTAELFQAKA